MLYPADRGSMYGALPRVLGNRGTKVFIYSRRTWKQKSTNEEKMGTKAILVEQGIFGNDDFFIFCRTKRCISGEQCNR